MLIARNSRCIAGLSRGLAKVIEKILICGDQESGAKKRDSVADHLTILIPQSNTEHEDEWEHKHSLPPAQVARQKVDDLRVDKRKDRRK